ncbi:MAG: replicative DNA helicase [Phycisphaeraceae bacterium]
MTTAPARRFEAPKPDVAKLLEKQPPAAIEAEMALLGSMILDWRVSGEVVQILRGGDDFYLPKHGAIYRVLVEAYDKNEPVDLVQLNQRLRDLDLLEQVGGIQYLMDLAEGVPSAASAPYYARIVRDKAVVRRLIDAAGNILHEAYTSAEPIGSLLDSAERTIFEIAESKGVSDAEHLNDLLQELYKQLEAQEGRHLTGLDTGFYDLNEMLSGLQNGEMIVIAGRPSMGKTAVAVNIAEHIGAVARQPVALFSLEMSKQQLAQRLLCSRSGVDAQKVRRNMLSPDDFHRLQVTVGELAEAPIYIDDTPGMSVLTLRAKSRRLVAQHGIKVIFVDYLQLMSQPGSESRQQEVSEMSRGIKGLARELNVPVVCLSQLNRGPEAREGHKPRMSDLRESGSIEQDADVVMMIHREEYYHDEEWKQSNPDKVCKAELIISKQRNGPVGTVELQFDPGTTRFHNLAQRASPSY